jgi:hypothetical protein
LPASSIEVDWQFATPVLYVGTLRGAYYSTTLGVAWAVAGEGLPNTEVRDLELAPQFDLLVAGTYGRGVFQTRTPEPVLLGPAVPLRAAASGFPAVSDPDTAFVEGLYRSLLSRNADSAGLSGWVGALRQGASRDDIAQAIWNSAEHRVRQVESYYEAYLHRQADAAGLEGWVGSLLSGASENDVALGFLSSQEYQVLHPSDTAFVEALYRDVLGRAPDSVGASGWTNALANGMIRASVASSFLSSSEALSRTVDGFYTSFLFRQADTLGAQGWFTAALNGTPLATIGQQFLASPEYLALTSSNIS